ncbi:MAG: hypothetical protein ACKO37_03060 [Vampirovibrionales bacterium]
MVINHRPLPTQRKRCEHCIHWQRYQPEVEDYEYPYDTGQCRFSPPSVLVNPLTNKLTTVWPQTKAWHWCGKFTQRPERMNDAPSPPDGYPDTPPQGFPLAHKPLHP